MKAFIAFSVILLLIVGGGLGYYGWGRWTKIEPRGVGLTLEHEIPADEKESLTERYNEVLDQEATLLPTIEKHDLKDYYGVASDAEALALFREDSFIQLPGGRNLHVLFSGKRSTRKIREAATRSLAEDFINAARLADEN